MDTPNPLARGNRFQRAYYRWALPYYERFGREDPALRERVELIDIYLYSREGLMAWIAWLLCLCGVAAAFHIAGMPLLKAVGASALILVGLSIALLAVWLKPQQGPARLVGGFMVSGLLGFAAMLLVLYVARGLLGETPDWDRVLQTIRISSVTLLPLGLSFALLLASVARAGRAAHQRQIARLQLVAERDAAARTAAEADLRLLQAQIHPHFVFNTLATLQHWVDRRDERAGPLLRELTGFLRRSTELLGRPTVPLADEVQAVRHYLAILDARLDGRVQGGIDVAAGLEAQPLPPGLLLTMVENAVEHGLEPKIGDGRLTVAAGRDIEGRWWLRVDDDGLGLADDAEDDVGLANLRQRLHHHFGARARFSLQRRAQGGTRAEILFALDRT
jgi:hypothetical protein